MAGSTNFLQHNPTEANQENDSQYAADSLRTGGIGTDAILPSVWLNKIWYQCTTFIAALAQALANKGYVVSDANLATLTAVLSNLLTNADVKPPLVSVGFSPTPVFDASTANGFDFVMAGNVSSSTLTNVSIGQTITFAITQGASAFTFVPPTNLNGWVPITLAANQVTIQTFIVKEDGTIWSVESLPAPTGSVAVNNGSIFVPRVLTQSSPSRAFGTTYVNTSGAELRVSVTGEVGSGGGSMTAFTGNGAANIAVCTQARVPAASSNPVEGVCFTFFVPVGFSYMVQNFGLTLALWTEWAYV